MKYSVIRFFLYPQFIISSAIILTFGLLLIHSEYSNLQKKSIEIEKQFIEGKEKNISSRVRVALSYIDYKRSTVEVRLKDLIKKKTYDAFSIINNIYQENRKSYSEQFIKKIIKDALRRLRYNDGRGYYFILRQDGIEELFPMNRKLEGTNFLKNKLLNPIIYPMIEMSKDRDEGYFPYMWTRPGNQKIFTEKISFVKVFRPYKWIVGTGEYKIDMMNIIQREVLSRFRDQEKSRNDLSNKMFILTGDGKTVFYNGKIIVDNMSINSNVISKVFDSFKKSETSFIKSSDNNGEIAYYEYFKKWNWIIGVSTDLKELSKLIDERERTKDNNIYWYATRISTMIVVLFILMLIINKVFQDKIKHHFEIFTFFFQKAEKDMSKIDRKMLMFSEFDLLATVANQMIDKRIELEDEKEKMTANIFITNKLASLGEMAAGIAHEINNPLTIIRGRADRIKRKFSDVDDVDTNSIDKIIASVDRIVKIVKSLRAFARSDSLGEFRTESVKDIVEDTISFCEDRFSSSGVKLEIDDINEGIVVFAKRSEVSQVLVNLLNNSLDAVLSQDNCWVKISVDFDSDYSYINVVDSGSGIGKDIEDKIFDPFFTTKDEHRGTGLGMSISQRIVESHSGSIYLDKSSPTTKFVVKIPCKGSKDLKK